MQTLQRPRHSRRKILVARRRQRLKHPQKESAGAAGPCRRMCPKSGAVVGIRDGGAGSSLNTIALLARCDKRTAKRQTRMTDSGFLGHLPPGKERTQVKDLRS
jgi:hypothetical protein